MPGKHCFSGLPCGERFQISGSDLRVLSWLYWYLRFTLIHMSSIPQGPDDYRAILYARQSVINTKYLDDTALNACQRWLQFGKNDVLVRQRGEKIGYANLQTCKKKWVCPVCADRAARQTRNALSRAIAAEAFAGYRPLFITYTAQHNGRDSLHTSAALVRQAHRSLHSGKRFSRAYASAGCDGSFRAYEITLGRSGWHFHIHELLFVANGGSGMGLAAYLSDGWPEHVSALGGYAKKDVGLVVETARASVAAYISKFGLAAELTQGVQKTKKTGGLLPFQLADVPYTDSGRTAWAGEKFAEYAVATKGLKQTATGGTLRALFRHIKDNPAIPDYETQILASLTTTEWSRVVKAGKRAALLSAIERHDLVAASVLVGRQFDDDNRQLYA